MRIQEIAKEKATVWFSRDELGFMIAAMERALKEMDADEFDTRTSRTVGYAHAVLAQLRVANGEARNACLAQEEAQKSVRTYEPDDPRRLKITIKVEVVSDEKALVSLSDYELCFLNNAVNEAIHGLNGVEEFERSSGKTREYGRRLMKQLSAANDKVEALE